MKLKYGNVPPLAGLAFIGLVFAVLLIGIFCMRDHYNEYPVVQLVHLCLSVTLLMASVLMFFRDWRLALSGIVIVLITGIRIPVF